MAGSASNTIENSLLNHLLRNTAYTPAATLYVALFTTNPTDAGPGTEVSGGAYARQVVTFGAASGGTVTNSNAITFPVATADWGTIEGFGIMDALTTGNMLVWCDSPSSAVASGQQASFAIGSLVVSLE